LRIYGEFSTQAILARDKRGQSLTKV